MRLLLDTHALLWSAHNPRKLSVLAAKVIRDGANDIFVSAVSAMEIATKHRLGKLEYDTMLATAFIAEVTGRGFALLTVDCEHAARAGNLVGEHRDPWDRLLAAQAQIEGLVLVSNDPKLAQFDVETCW
jgi:PIN domain nuclease of toxin-antitoxin system